VVLLEGICADDPDSFVTHYAHEGLKPLCGAKGTVRVVSAQWMGGCVECARIYRDGGGRVSKEQFEVYEVREFSVTQEKVVELGLRVGMEVEIEGLIYMVTHLGWCIDGKASTIKVMTTVPEVMTDER